ncbi:MAG: energy transducer TonB [Chitinophagaceae bacterium]|nr:energy transducer TonB [Chitinophagaceae bacterium]
METKNIMSSDLLDILFEGRNKQYGAYDLRKTYSKRIRVALISTGAVVAVFIAATLFAGNGSGNIIDMVGPEITLSKVEDKPIEKELPPPPPKQEVPKVEISRFTPPKIVIDNEVKQEDEIIEVEKLEDTKIGTFNQDGNKDDGIVIPPVEKAILGNGEGIKKEPDYENAVFTIVQNPAEFPGGLAGWTKYLQKNLNSDLPVQNGAPVGKYTVVVSFIVAKDGTISDVVAENDPGYGTKAEAVRVIQKGPSWKPAVQNGKNVIYRQRQSIVFMVNED